MASDEHIKADNSKNPDEPLRAEPKKKRRFYLNDGDNNTVILTNLTEDEFKLKYKNMIYDKRRLPR